MEDWQHIIEHAELINKQGLVKFVVEKPDSTYQDADYKNRRVLYKSCVLPPPCGACWIRVIIEYRMLPISKKGWVVTAHASNKNKREGEVLLWNK